jgi:hypothetical protein
VLVFFVLVSAFQFGLVLSHYLKLHVVPSLALIENQKHGASMTLTYLTFFTHLSFTASIFNRDDFFWSVIRADRPAFQQG